jgi:hypothetical protein
MEKGHAIAMDGLNQQLHKSLAENAILERQLKDQENQGKKKDIQLPLILRNGVKALTSSSITSKTTC